MPYHQWQEQTKTVLNSSKEQKEPKGLLEFFLSRDKRRMSEALNFVVSLCSRVFRSRKISVFSFIFFPSQTPQVLFINKIQPTSITILSIALGKVGNTIGLHHAGLFMPCLEEN